MLHPRVASLEKLSDSFAVCLPSHATQPLLFPHSRYVEEGSLNPKRSPQRCEDHSSALKSPLAAYAYADEGVDTRS